MIALILYEADIPGYHSIEDKFDIWYYYYCRSGTKMDFQIFTDAETNTKYSNINKMTWDNVYINQKKYYY